MAEAPEKAVTAVAIDNSVEKEKVFQNLAGDGSFSEQEADNRREQEDLWFVLLRFAGSFLLLLTLVWVVIAVLKRILPTRNQLFNSRSVEVLSRTHLDSRRYVALVRIGVRVLVVGVGPESITVLSEIIDKEEVSAILQEARPATESGKSIFRKLLQSSLLRGPEENAKITSGGEGDSFLSQGTGKDSIHARLRGRGANGQ
ncbi:MAG: flagellar biosynthetic protein FliO [Planctomycetes bacterium]|nr:flagellar biosynthetic protein FliO [Planctomycetota bacterium]